MLADRMKLRFSLKSWFVLILGFAIGFSMNLPLRQFVASLLHPPSIATNSNRFFVITEQSAGRGKIQSMTITGNETVFDAITQAGGIADPNSTQVTIVRPPVDGVGVKTTLHVDWARVASRDPTATNYALNVGDRVYISPKSELAAVQ